MLYNLGNSIHAWNGGVSPEDENTTGFLCVVCCGSEHRVRKPFILYCKKCNVKKKEMGNLSWLHTGAIVF